MKTIEILVGIPCSGKSTYSDLMEINNNTVILSRDTIRETLFIQPYIYSKYNENKVTNIFSKLITNLKESEVIDIIILDNTHCKEKYINEIIKNNPDCTIKIKFFDISLYKAHYRNIIRYIKTGKWIPIKVINNMYKNYNNINKKKYEKYMVY